MISAAEVRGCLSSEKARVLALFRGDFVCLSAARAKRRSRVSLKEREREVKKRRT
jgi:hypothetical protein